MKTMIDKCKLLLLFATTMFCRFYYVHKILTIEIAKLECFHNIKVFRYLKQICYVFYSTQLKK